ncbi:MAG: carbohydrate binding domain-containing protein, partial [Acutalibacteraceae bacterium]|nr:carbohydrate binding domain-containing protein [Acutalibacteraceae bacterium]
MVIIKRIAKRACATLLASTILTSMLSLSSISAVAAEANTQAEEKAVTQSTAQSKYAGYATGDLTPRRSEYPEDAVVIRTESDYYNAVYGNSEKDRAVMPLPESCDNSTSKYFPPVNSQGAIGSCVCWAQVYYQYSYTVNQMLNREATYENSFSPKFAYNLVNGGYDSGSADDAVYDLLKNIGAPSLESVPYDNNWLTWSFDESAWSEAGKYRLKSHQFIELPKTMQFVTSADDSDLDAVKAALANGDVLSYSTCIGSWKYSTLKSNPDAPENDKFSGQEVVLWQEGIQGGHRMAIVGYNDNIWTDINDNNKVDDGEMGAFKIVNSWGTNVHNQGFAWVAYDALNIISVVDGIDVAPERRSIIYGIERIEVERKSAESNIFLKYTVNSATRTKTPIKLLVEKSNTKSEYYLTPYNLTYDNNLTGREYSYGGSYYAADAIFYADLSEHLPELNSDNISDYSISVSFADTQADTEPLTVKSLELVDAGSNTIYRPENFVPFSLDGDEKIVDIIKSTERAAIVYYNGYYTPNIEYKTQNGSWTPAPGYEMELSCDVDEYTHKYVIPLAENEDSAVVRFNDGKGSYDSNNNNNYTAYEGLNYFKTSGLPPIEMKLSYESSMPDDNVVNMDSFHIITLIPEGGFAPYKYKYSRLDVENGYFFESEFKSESDSNRISLVGFYSSAYVYTFTVEDRLGNQATVTVDITVEDLQTGVEYFKINDGNEVYVGDQPIFEILTKNEKGNFGTSEYLIDVYNHDTGERSSYLPYQLERVYKNKLSIDQAKVYTKWKAEKAGNYTAYITIKDMTGKQTTSSVDFKVLKSTAIEIDSFSVSPAGKSGVYEKVTMTADATGGTGALEYKFSYKKDGKEYIIQDYSEKNTATIEFGENTGEYELTVSVKDSSGKEVSKKKSFTVLPTIFKEISFSRATAKKGQTVQIIPVIENEASVIKPEHYRYTVEKNGVSKKLTASSDKTASWTPAEEGEYTITVEVIYN